MPSWVGLLVRGAESLPRVSPRTGPEGGSGSPDPRGPVVLLSAGEERDAGAHRAQRGVVVLVDPGAGRGAQLLDEPEEVERVQLQLGGLAQHPVVADLVEVGVRDDAQQAP